MANAAIRVAQANEKVSERRWNAIYWALISATVGVGGGLVATVISAIVLVLN